MNENKASLHSAYVSDMLYKSGNPRVDETPALVNPTLFFRAIAQVPGVAGI